MAVALSAAAGSTAPAFAQAPLAVPYLPQSEALCGGAAAAMVMRFWGARGVYADAFAPLVDKTANGIHTSALTRDLQARGWRVDAGGGDLPRLTQEVGRGRPVIALIEDRPQRFHFVVVVAAPAGGPVTLHDPARAPGRRIAADVFDRKWRQSDRWMLVLLPGTASTAPADPEAHSVGASADEKKTADRECGPSVDEAVAMAGRGDTAAARRLLDAATRRCPGEGAAWRELAGLDALDRQWVPAAAHARMAVERDPDDDYAWRLLGTAEYLRQADLEALAAWNHVGEPRVDLIDINGLARTRYLIVADAIGVQPRATLTPDALRVAERRVRDIPAIATARVTFHPLDRGDAQIDATVVERARAPRGWPAWAAMGIGAVANSELAASFANVSGGGDVVDVSWRWWERRPRIGGSYAAPGPGGIWRLEAFRETQTFGAGTEEVRVRVAADLGNWINQRLHVRGGAALDKWRGLGRTPAVSGRIQFWPAVDRLSIDLGGSGWRGGSARFGTADTRVRLRTGASMSGTVWLSEAGYQLATATAPASLWPGADTGHARDVQLRAHPLLDEGVIRDGVFGRRVAFASAEVQRWLRPVGHRLLRVAPAAFLDVAHATQGLATSNTRAQFDLGAGVRLSLPGAGVLRIDLARGLRDGTTALSVGWQR